MAEKAASNEARAYPTEFVRHRSGKSYEVIHRWSCGAVKRMKHPLPWNWADERPPSQWVHLAWFRPCQKCCPDLASLARVGEGS